MTRPQLPHFDASDFTPLDICTYRNPQYTTSSYHCSFRRRARTQPSLLSSSSFRSISCFTCYPYSASGVYFLAAGSGCAMSKKDQKHCCTLLELVLLRYAHPRGQDQSDEWPFIDNHARKTGDTGFRARESSVLIDAHYRNTTRTRRVGVKCLSR